MEKLRRPLWLVAIACMNMITVSAQGTESFDKWSAVPVALQQWIDWGELSGAVTLVAKDGKIVEFDAIGVSNLASQRRMKKDDLFWIASMTKPMTAAAVLLLSDEGKLSIEDPVSKYLPSFKDLWMVSEKSDAQVILKKPSREVTIRDLLTHMHGLHEPASISETASLADVVDLVARGPLEFEPGTQWRYGNASMSVLGRIVEVVSGEAYQDFLQERFFNPLGMTETTFHPTDEQFERLATSYCNSPETGALTEMDIFLFPGKLLRSPQHTIAPGGGLFSTAMDVFKFYQMLLNGGEFDGRRYLKVSTVKEMFTSQTGDKKAGFCEGMGWGLGIGVVTHPEGWTRGLAVGTVNHDGAYGTTVFLDPSRNLLFIMLIQRGGLGGRPDGMRFRFAFTSAVMEAAGN